MKPILLNRYQSKIRCKCGRVVKYNTLRWGRDPLTVCECGQSFYKETIWSPPLTYQGGEETDAG